MSCESTATWFKAAKKQSCGNTMMTRLENTCEWCWKMVLLEHNNGEDTAWVYARDKVCTRIASKCLRSCIYTFYFHLFSPWPLLEIWRFNIAHVPVQDMRIRLLRVLRHDCEEADSIEKLEEGGSNIFVVLQRMPAVHVLRAVDGEVKCI